MAYFNALSDIASEPSADDIYDCFDYLQQAITCLADTNLEDRLTSKPSHVAPSGYSSHQCRDSAGIFQFSEKWRVWNGKTFKEMTNISEEENVPGRTISYGKA